jgi:hypothetical protein
VELTWDASGCATRFRDALAITLRQPTSRAAKAALAASTNEALRSVRRIGLHDQTWRRHRIMADVSRTPAPPDDEQEAAFLIIAHHQPNHLARLVRALDGCGSRIFVHVDAKVPLGPFQVAVPQQAKLAFVEDRLAVGWGELSVVEATLKLIDLAIASGAEFRYFTLLSGSDYPIRPIGEIISRLRASNDEYLRVDRCLTDDPGGSHHHVLGTLPGRRYFGNLTPFHGSMHWALTNKCVRYVRQFMADYPGFLEFHRNVVAPDEVFFHTIVKQSPFAAAIVQDFSNGIHPNRTQHGLHFIDWRSPWPQADLTLDENNLDDLLASDCLFARKFDEIRSRRLLDLLDQRVHKSRNGEETI